MTIASARCAVRLVTGFVLALAVPVQPQTILVKPYIQPGYSRTFPQEDAKTVMWVADQVAGEFTVEYGPPSGAVATAKATRIVLDIKPSQADAKGITPPNLANQLNGEVPIQSAVSQHYFRYSAVLEKLPLDSHIQYRVKLKDHVIREATFRTRASGTKPIKFIMVGDLTDGKAFQNEVAFQMAKTDPDFLVLLGDIPCIWEGTGTPRGG